MSTRPNIVVVLCDQMRRQAMSCAGDPNVSTPHLDGLASEGVRFENACSTFPVCVPARFSLLTGEYPHTRNVPNIDWQMSPAERTFAHTLSEAGYRTAWIGKWHLAAHIRYEDLSRDEKSRRVNRTPVPPRVQGGFDYWRGFELRNQPFDTAYFVDADPEPRMIDGYQTDGLFDLGYEFLDDHADDDRPFCLVVSVEPPHPPLIAPEPYLERFTDQELTLRPNVRLDEESLPKHHRRWGSTERASEDLFTLEYWGPTLLDDVRAYYAMIENLDDNVGNLLAELRTRGLRDDTALIFTSDHGESLGSHGRIGKGRPYAESIGVPLIVSYPGDDIDDGRVVSTPTCTEDIAPTILGIAEVAEATGMPGEDLGPLLRGTSDTLDRPGVLLEYVRYSGGSETSTPWRGFCTERYTYAVKGGDRGGEPWQLFDHADDPYEQDNVVDDPAYEDVAAGLHGHLRDALSRTDDGFPLARAFGHKPLNVHFESV